MKVKIVWGTSLQSRIGDHFYQKVCCFVACSHFPDHFRLHFGGNFYLLAEFRLHLQFGWTLGEFYAFWQNSLKKSVFLHILVFVMVMVHAFLFWFQLCSKQWLNFNLTIGIFCIMLVHPHQMIIYIKSTSRIDNGWKNISIQISGSIDHQMTDFHPIASKNHDWYAGCVSQSYQSAQYHAKWWLTEEKSKVKDLGGYTKVEAWLIPIGSIKDDHLDMVLTLSSPISGFQGSYKVQFWTWNQVTDDLLAPWLKIN